MTVSYQKKVLSKSNIMQLFKRVNNNENVITNNDIELHIEIL